MSVHGQDETGLDKAGRGPRRRKKSLKSSRGANGRVYTRYGRMCEDLVGRAGTSLLGGASQDGHGHGQQGSTDPYDWVGEAVGSSVVEGRMIYRVHRCVSDSI